MNSTYMNLVQILLNVSKLMPQPTAGDESDDPHATKASHPPTHKLIPPITPLETSSMCTSYLNQTSWCNVRKCTDSDFDSCDCLESSRPSCDRSLPRRSCVKATSHNDLPCVLLATPSVPIGCNACQCRKGYTHETLYLWSWRMTCKCRNCAQQQTSKLANTPLRAVDDCRRKLFLAEMEERSKPQDCT